MKRFKETLNLEILNIFFGKSGSYKSYFISKQFPDVPHYISHKKDKNISAQTKYYSTLKNLVYDNQLKIIEDKLIEKYQKKIYYLLELKKTLFITNDTLIYNFLKNKTEKFPNFKFMLYEIRREREKIIRIYNSFSQEKISEFVVGQKKMFPLNN